MEDDQIKQSLRYIANILFWVNIVPSAVGLVVDVVALCYAIFHFREGSLYFAILLTIGLLCEWVYHKQRLSLEYAGKSIGWIYSIIVNVIFLVPYISMLFADDSGVVPMAIMGLYPLAFLCVSCYALLKTRKLNNSIGKD